MKTCAFTCSNENYLLQSIVALTSARKWGAEIDLFLITENLSAKGYDLLEQYGIKPIVVRLNDHFSHVWDYPRECYFLFAAPQLLSERGYDAGIYLDADTIVNGNVSIMLDDRKNLSGVEVGPIKKVLKKDVPILESEFGPIPDRNRIQSGVLAMTFAPLVKADLLGKASHLFDKCLEIGAPRKGDDSLLALIQAVHPEIGFDQANDCFNMIENKTYRQGGNRWHRIGEETLTKDGVFHFTGKSKKPWDMPNSFPSFRAKYFTKKWYRHAVDTLSKEDLCEFLPDLANQLSINHLKFYWYPESNVGDQITPYFAKKANNGIVNQITEAEIKNVEKTIRIPQIVTNVSNVFVPNAVHKKADYIVSCGSVVRLCGNHALVFGSGIRSSEQSVKNAIIRFTRGPLTRKRFLAKNIECPAVFGDPALLLPRVFFPDVEKKYDLGIIPHFTEVSHFKKNWDIGKEDIILDPQTTDVETFLRLLLQCRRTVSSSLHGLIFSHAYKIPTRHVMLTDQIYGDGTKFRDHYECVGISHRPLRLSDHTARDELFSAANETTNFDDRFLWDEMFFDSCGMKTSVSLPF